MSANETPLLHWPDLAPDLRAALAGRLAGLWNWSTDEVVFDNLGVDKQQALLLLVRRIRQKELWPVVRRVTNVYGGRGEGVGLGFDAWPVIASTLKRRPDFTQWFANHKDTTGGFYERGRATAVLHFLYVDKPGAPREWFVHFDLYSPVHSPASALQHLRHEAFGGYKPDWQTIKAALSDTA
ncbi:MAG TPA: hypothetical protein VF525_13210 [Pyrinomonadaceae bacterium]|jgi:hypothetical protein